VAAHDVRYVRDPLVKQLLQLRERAELGVMVELDVQDDGDLRTKRRDRAVGLVALDDEPALPRAGVAAELRDHAADRERGIAPELAQDERDHPARRRLAVS